MRHGSVFSRYCRYVALHGLFGDGPDGRAKLGAKSLLAGLAAQESLMFVNIARWAGVIR